jgi:DNA-binding NarL/FixJ family response regulator
MNGSDGIPCRAVHRSIEILLVDDQRLMRDGLRTLLELHPDLRVVGEAGDGLEAETLVERLRPRVVLMDLRMPRRDGVEATRRITARWPEIQVLVLTTFDDDELVFRSIEAGASGYLLKDVGSEALAEAVRAASRGESPLQPSIARKVLKRLRAGGVRSIKTHTPGEPTTVSGVTTRAPHPAAERIARAAERGEPLTHREAEVLGLLGTGATNREIAERLSLTEGTVKNYISAILTKTGLRDRTQAALFAVRHGLSAD